MKIYHPITGKKYSINSKIGKKILYKYLIQYAGSQKTAELEPITHINRLPYSEPGIFTSLGNMFLNPKKGIIDPLFSAGLGFYHNFISLRNPNFGNWNHNLFTINMNENDNLNFKYSSLKYYHSTSSQNIKTLALDVERILKDNNLFNSKLPIVLLGHSMGGLIAQYLSRVIYKNKNKKIRYIQINSPDLGTPLFNNCLVRGICKLKIGNNPIDNFAKYGKFIRDLIDAGHDSKTLRFISDTDAVVPYHKDDIEFLRNKKNVTIISTGHSAVLYDDYHVNMISDMILDQFKPKAHFIFCHGLNANPGQGIKLLLSIKEKAKFI